MTDIGYTHQTGETVHTVPEGFQQTVTLRPDQVALRTSGGGTEITWAEYDRRVRELAAGLAGLGVRHGDTVGIMLTNRPEFNIVDTAALHVGAVPFSVYNTSSAEQVTHLFGNAGNRVVVTERAFLPVVTAAGADLAYIVVVDGPAADADDTAPRQLSLDDVVAAAPADFDFDAAWQAVQPDDLATLIYTSGTTGPSKGVEITHANVIAQLALLQSSSQPCTIDDRLVSYLPAAHVADRMSAHGNNQLTGAVVTCVADPRQIATALPDARPTAMFGVPRVWQKLKAGIEAKLATEPSPVKKALGLWSLRTAVAHARAELRGGANPLLALQYRLADALVLSKVRAALGLDRLQVAASGAAAIPAETLEFLLGLGFGVSEVWGMSETTGVATYTPVEAPRPGSVGTAGPGIEVKLAEDGELLVRGPVVTRGYRGMPEKTAEALSDDGWLATGDVATIDADGYVTIVDRKKELIITEAGKNISPTNIENAVKTASSLVGPIVAIGEARAYVTALIVLEPDTAAARAQTLGLATADPATVAAHPAVIAEIRGAVATANARLSRAEQIKRFRILPQAWEPGGDELTPTLKLRRVPIAAKYATEIEELYTSPAPDGVVDLG
ncbi:AMP-dependent synthetase/ligase [Nocardia stercoris]|uniref:Acyl-CoA synthetase n=1 Tax=Nocardia stercoris TaxID=2483361 RepID=A0A3M2L8B1_9NOCA|nr:long-chain fatty acid--CoA ligase [Nocardia stercoris]RMI33266.1 long-chain fatty acid--CoA ligase [Nocardia stercoris]